MTARKVIIRIDNGGSVYYSEPETERMVSERGRILWTTWPSCHRFMPYAEVQDVAPEDVPAAARRALSKNIPVREPPAPNPPAGALAPRGDDPDDDPDRERNGRE